MVEGAILNVAYWHIVSASSITKYSDSIMLANIYIYFVFKENYQFLLWYPLFVPHIVGEPKFPGEVIWKESVRHDPMADPFNWVVSPEVPVTWVDITNF